MPPTDHFTDLRSEMVRVLLEIGIDVEMQHHEVGTAGQAEIDFRFGTLLKTADNLMNFKYVIKNVARAHGRTVTFMPKPIFQDNGSGMHCHQSLWKGGEPLFFSETGYAGLSDMARWYIGGLLAHAPAILAFAAPTTNSYKRLVPGYEAPVNLVYSQRNRSACVRIPVYSKSPKAKRLEFRPPDPSCNPYLAFPAMLMAGLDGVKNKIEPPDPIDKDLYDLPPKEAAQVKQVPGSLEEVLDALEGDHQFMLEGGVITQDVNAFDSRQKFDRIVSVEMFEHLKNYDLLLANIGRWLRPGGLLFVHIFTHHQLSYHFVPRDESDWMSRHFFAGGQTFDQLGSAHRFIVLVITDERLRDLIVLQQNSGVPRVLGRDKIDIFQNFQRADSEIAQISDWRGDDVKHRI